ncbi:hypothetical protein [Komagataeibacter sp. FXV3]|uniref:hypothetical protein n=1 Tax=Komagataeibacter sp. FXV3 TaxID=2608998 RepID=UPI00187B61F6|nr:hypothetical protein [Komagataeibacter sp. FXV3]MBE7729052.1 hypothetical protein [Komagataeibacter sp. FXV3]
MNSIAHVSETTTTVTVNRADWEAILNRLDDRQDREAIAQSEIILSDYCVTYTADETRRTVLDGVRKLIQGDLVTRVLRAQMEDLLDIK